MPKPKRGAVAEAARILPGLLEPKVVALDSLTPDPRNARKHGPKNLAAIRDSLRKFGQHRPLVVQLPGRVVRAGNGTLAAMRELGWTEAAVVFVEEDDAEAVARAIADNRSGELAAWDEPILASMLDELPDDLRDAAGFSAAELERLARKLEAAPMPQVAAPPRTARYTRLVHLHYSDAEHAEFERLAQEAATRYREENLSQAVLKALRELSGS